MTFDVLAFDIITDYSVKSVDIMCRSPFDQWLTNAYMTGRSCGDMSLLFLDLSLDRYRIFTSNIRSFEN
jgi:hypothetical protein